MPLLIPALLILLVAVLLLHVGLFFSVVLFLLGVYAVARIWISRSVRHLAVERRFDDHAFAGERVLVDVTLRNLGRLPMPWVESSESAPVELRLGQPASQVFSLPGRGIHRFGYELRCRKRGYYELGPLHLQTGDVLGIEEQVLSAAESHRLIVYPRVVPLHQLGLPTHSTLATLPAKTPLFEDPTRIIGVRDYQPGDTMRRIHWPATARLDRLVVKQYQPAVARDTLVFLDLDPDSYPVNRYEAIEQGIVVAASLVSHVIVREGLSAGLALDAHDPRTGEKQRVSLPPRSQRIQLTTVLEVLAWVNPTPGHFLDLMRRGATGLTWGATAVVITGRLTEDLSRTAVQMQRSGFAVSLILIQPASVRGGDEPSSLRGVRVHHVWADRDLARWQ